ncbi:Ankyrin repeat domain-containing protein 17 [Phytophthora cinnamomi]|uniref:Ankyrin repeat domain-containing protein 17 n=1 Tax=Phytophthora cinnamomi TaxID=4785 RepID=UPI00355A0F27|nr:Ankyrin repeat domain-containing protein 17 [Phytophthora cinnamomi]
MKTSEEQGLSLFPDPDFSTCPLLAMTLALLMQAAPSSDVIDNLPQQPSQVAIELSPNVPLLEILDHPITTLGLAALKSTGLDTTTIIYAHVNRVLDRIAKSAGVVAALTSHSFRRGEAQHANASGSLTARSIFEFSAWNMTTTNKGFYYIFNTSKQDHKISKIFSGRDAEANVSLQQLKAFDSQTRTKIDAVQRLLFAACQDLEAASHNVNQPVLDALIACVL